MASTMHQKENANVNIAQKMGRTFNPSELKMMLGQCLKLASENKITALNTWGLPLIEHLPELVKEDQPGETNFQKASVTLDAGVKIYSYRVDSVHTETFKILGGIGRAQGPTNDDGEEGDDTNPDGTSPTKRRRRHAELNPEATLEPSLEALNVKKFDLAFAVDPLFHKTSAQFDEGGAKGLLLANLSVYRGCDIVFDSMDVPEQAGEAAAAVAQAAGPVNLSSIAPQLEAVRKLQQQQDKNNDGNDNAAVVGHHRMSPAMDDILSLLGLLPTSNEALAAEDFVQRVASGHVLLPTTSLASSRSDVASLMMAAAAATSEGGGGEGGMMMMSYDEQVAAEYAEMNAGMMMDDGGYDDDMGGGGGFDDDDDGGADDFTNGASHHHHSNQHGFGSAAAPLDEDAVQWLIAAGNEGSSGRGGGVMAAKGWAGASHWRYRSALPPPGTGGNGLHNNNNNNEDGEASSSMTNNATTARRSRRRNEPLDFVALMMQDGAGELDFDQLPKNKGAGVRRKKPVANTLLPEDHHYAAESLVRYALRPTAMIGGGVRGEEERGVGGGGGGFGEYGAYNDMNDDDGGGGYDDGYGDGDDGGDWMMPALLEREGALELVDAARRVEKVEVGYSRAAKQVDVKSLKELMWDGLQKVMEERRARGVVVAAVGGEEEEPIQLGEVLAAVPEMNAAGRLEDLSVHLCFICVLHLANEHGLVVRGVEGLDELLVSNVPVMAAG